MKLKQFVLILIGVFSLHIVSAQSSKALGYHREVTWGINKNTNSWLIGGFALKFGKHLGNGLFQTIGTEIMFVAHEQEIKYQGGLGTRFIWAKQNHLRSVRFQYGREKLLFKKASQNGVQISTFVMAGPTIGLISPYYVRDANGTAVKFSESGLESFESVGGGVFPFKGIGESSFTFGGNVKAGLNFEFGDFNSSVFGLELGGALEAFTEKVPIMLNDNNHAFFHSLYVTLYWGRRR